MSASPAPTPDDDEKASFVEFFWLWAREQRWTVPEIHWRAVHWLETRGRLAVLRCFRGFGKSTILAVYNAWRYYHDPGYRILHQGDQDKTAFKTSRDTRAVLRRHPLTRGQFADDVRGEASFWWAPGNNDERNPSMQAAGITSNITSSRCDEAQNDDVEVPRNITNPENREKMRYRLGEQVHCMVPGARRLFIGTPHTHDSLYDEVQAMGADCLTIRMFEREHRIERATRDSYELPFVPDIVLSGIGKGARALVRGKDYTLHGKTMRLKTPTGALLDCYAGSAWPERFDLEEMEKRRKETRTINEWDSQYQLHSRPTHDIRLDPDRMIEYHEEPKLRAANGSAVMTLGDARIVGMACRWDPASGKLKSDVSAVALILQDDAGRRYLHRVVRLTGDIAEFDQTGHNIIGGQVYQLAMLVRQFHVPRVTIETNGLGQFAPATLKQCLKQQRIVCGVAEEVAAANKNRRILEALEPLLMSDGYLWAHASVHEGPLPPQMRDWNAAVQDQADDYLDVTAGAVTESPERIQSRPSVREISPARPGEDWRPKAGVYEVQIEV